MKTFNSSKKDDFKIESHTHIDILNRGFERHDKILEKYGRKLVRPRDYANSSMQTSI